MRLRWITMFLVLVVEVSPTAGAQQDVGHIQVKADPGIQIFLNGTFKGLTNADVGGLIIQGVPPGMHTLRAVKPGFHSQDTRLSVTKGQVLVYALKPFVPKVQISEQGEEQSGELALRVGALVVQTLPVECVIDSPPMGLKNVRKNKDVWSVSQIPEGSYDITFRALGKTLRHRVTIKANETERLMVNFVEGKVVDLVAEERRLEELRKQEQAKRWAEEAKRREEEELRRRREEARAARPVVIELQVGGSMPGPPTDIRSGIPLVTRGSGVQRTIRASVSTEGDEQFGLHQWCGSEYSPREGVRLESCDKVTTKAGRVKQFQIRVSCRAERIAVYWQTYERIQIFSDGVTSPAMSAAPGTKYIIRARYDGDKKGMCSYDLTEVADFIAVNE